jgi:ABC-type amino acid transport substrate-binding protein/ABC-type amino acid transport system permease subunit
LLFGWTRAAARLATIVAVLFVTAVPSLAAGAGSPDAALARLLAQARDAVPGTCGQPGLDRLVRILCSGSIRVGVRDSYPLFADKEGGTRQGYEIDIARAIAGRLGVDVAFVGVKAANRIAKLADDEIDVTIATMGHNVQRDGQARFVRPHYYRSETILVGPRQLRIADWPDIPGRTVCVTVGNGSNAELVSRGSRLLLFDDAGLLPDRLRDRSCALAAQDDSFFASYFTDPTFAERFDAKFGFARVPWGMAVPRDHSERLGRALDLISQIFHRDGVFLDLARAHHIRTSFLEQQQAVWRQPECDTDRGSADPDCILPPLDAAMQPTSIAAQVSALENWLMSHAGIEVMLPMFKTAPAWSLFLDGIVNSLLLVVGALAATLCFALLFGALLGSRLRLARWPARFLVIALQSSPIVLTLVIAAAIAHALFAYSSALALAAAIIALGLANGCNAGQAISEAIAVLRQEQPAAPNGGRAFYAQAHSQSATQVTAFLINAAKGTPIARFNGAPELLSALTDISSFASGRVTIYTLLLLFYTAVVMVVVRLCNRFKIFLERSRVAA